MKCREEPSCQTMDTTAQGSNHARSQALHVQDVSRLDLLEPTRGRRYAATLTSKSTLIGCHRFEEYMLGESVCSKGSQTTRLYDAHAMLQ